MTDQRQRRPRDPCIPGLVSKAYVRGSRHEAPCPVQTKSEIDDNSGRCHFEWEATGSNDNQYTISAIGKVDLQLSDGAGSFNSVEARGLTVRCSCPDGERQAAKSLSSSGRIYVCKHAAAALDSCVDEEAEAKLSSDIARLKQQKADEESRRKSEEEAAKETQEQELPGERARIEYCLEAMSQKEITQQLKQACKSVEGLRAMACIFPKSVAPTPQTKFCLRCEKNYDDRYPTQKVCRVTHPYKFCHTEWESSKISWRHCYRCDGAFDVPDYYRRGPYDVGEWCYEGEHTQDEDVIENEKWNADPGDLVY